jgi:hypothetical protein
MSSKLEEIIKDKVNEMLVNNIDLYEDQDYYELDEINTTSAIDGYNTPYAFSNKNDNRRIKVLLKGKSLEGYKIVGEAVDNKDIKLIKLVIRDEVADILKTIWLKRSAWK